MLIPDHSSKKQEKFRNPTREAKLHHQGMNGIMPLGCGSCPDKEICGGLSISQPFFDCLSDYCCNSPGDCDVVCLNNPKDYAERFLEVGSFDFENVPRACKIDTKELPDIVPVIYNGSSRVDKFSSSTVALVLYSVIPNMAGRKRFETRESLVDKFKLSDNSSIVLTGTKEDVLLENWWSIGEPKRKEAIRNLCELGIELVTTPNYSLFTDLPRWDDLHSMKRIAITHSEFLNGGISAALHINARTNYDYERWSNYLISRSEITHISFEFTTGAGKGDRSKWHLDMLKQLSATVGRRLKLIVRGASLSVLFELGRYFEVTALDTTVFMKTAKRKLGHLYDDDLVAWTHTETFKGEPIDELLEQNWNTIKELHRNSLSRRS